MNYTTRIDDNTNRLFAIVEVEKHNTTSEYEGGFKTTECIKNDFLLVDKTFCRNRDNMWQ